MTWGRVKKATDSPSNTTLVDRVCSGIWLVHVFVVLQASSKATKLWQSTVRLYLIWIWCISKAFYRRNSLYAWWWGNILVILCRQQRIQSKCEITFHFTYRSSRTEPPDLAGTMRVTDDLIDSLVCPPPPTEPPAMSDEMINGLIVPAPGWSEYIFAFSYDFPQKHTPNVCLVTVVCFFAATINGTLIIVTCKTCHWDLINLSAVNLSRHLLPR